MMRRAQTRFQCGAKACAEGRASHDLPRVLVTVLSERHNMDSWDAFQAQRPCLYQSVNLLENLYNSGRLRATSELRPLCLRWQMP